MYEFPFHPIPTMGILSNNILGYKIGAGQGAIALKIESRKKNATIKISVVEEVCVFLDDGQALS